MKVAEFIKASYLEMIFKHSDTECIIYDFTWEDDEAESNFLRSYGDYNILKFKGVTPGLIDVYIEK